MARIENSSGLDAALRRAARFAAREGSEVLAPQHVLWGLLTEEEGLPFRMLSEAGVDPRPLLSLPLDDEPDDESAMPPGPALTRVLRRARRAVPWHSSEGTITTDLVLLALLELDENFRASLILLGLDWERWRVEHPLEAPALELAEPLQLDEAPDSQELTRVLDAVGNRAREALRVLEDYTRFILDDALLTRELKTLRHGLVDALGPLALPFLHARATLDDVGTGISTPQERDRGSLAHVALVNAKRLQEALRSLEEFGKLHSPDLGKAIEQLRYRAYTVERAMLLAGETRERLAGATLYVLVTEKMCRLSWIGTVREALEGGADVIQLREKGLDDRTLLERCREVRKMTRDHGALFIVNDRPDMARLSDADGVHLGQEDLPLRAARRILGAEALIGVSTHDLEQVRSAVLEGANYIGVGPTFPSRTKEFTHWPGLAFIRAVSDETSLPAFALGGITLENLDAALQAGTRRVAVSHAICAAEDPRETAREFKRRLVSGA